MVDKKLVPLCELLRAQAVEHGLVDVAVENHLVTPKMAPAFWQNFIAIAIYMILFCIICNGCRL